MAAASQSQSEAQKKLARLQSLQQSESQRQRQQDLAAKEREKQELQRKIVENAQRAKDSPPVSAAAVVKKVPEKPKILQPV
jgi:hypothetical protein